MLRFGVQPQSRFSVLSKPVNECRARVAAIRSSQHFGADGTNGGGKLKFGNVWKFERERSDIIVTLERRRRRQRRTERNGMTSSWLGGWMKSMARAASERHTPEFCLCSTKQRWTRSTTTDKPYTFDKLRLKKNDSKENDINTKNTRLSEIKGIMCISSLNWFYLHFN